MKNNYNKREATLKMLADSAIAEKQINAICEAIRKDYEQKGIVIEQPKAFYPSEANQDLWGC
jgi:hypothetical protein